MKAVIHKLHNTEQMITNNGLIEKKAIIMSEAQPVGHDLIAELFGNSGSESEAHTAEAFTQDKTTAITKQRMSCFGLHHDLSNFQGHRSCV
jgi:hypothetical protein